MKTSGILLLVLVSTTSFAFKNEVPGKLLQPQYSTARECEGRPEFLSEIRSDFVSSLSQLPQTVLVARQAEYYVEGKKGDNSVTMYGYQSFLKKNPQAQVLCGQVSGDVKERFSLLAPTLIDTHKKPRVGQSLWQFQMMTEGSKFSFWNLKSPSLASRENIEGWLKDTGSFYKIYQRSHDEYELLLIKKDGELTQYLSIRYDAIQNLKHRE